MGYSDDVLAIRRLSIAYSESFDSGDVNTWVELFAPDGHWRTPPQTWSDPEAALLPSWWLVVSPKLCRTGRPPSPCK